MQSGALKTAGDALRYRWPIAVAIIALSLVCGVLAAKLTPTQYTAEAQLYVDPTQNSAALNASNGLLNRYFTQQVTARRVVQRALDSLAAAESNNQYVSDLGGKPTVAQVASRILATAVLGTTAIAIDATGPTASGAANLANALAQAVIDQNRDDAAQRYVNSDQLLQAELTRLSYLINHDTSPEQLASDRAQYQTTYNNLENLQIQQAKDVESLSITEQAQPPTKPSAPDLARDAAVALVAGFVIGGLAILLVERFDDRIHNGTDLAEAAGTSLTVEVEVDGTGTLADRPFALAYAHMMVGNPAARIFMVAGAAAQDRSGPTAASLGAAAAASFGEPAENAGKRSVVLRAESETASVSQPLGAEASSTTALASNTVMDSIQTIRASRRKFAFLSVPSMLVSPIALTVAGRVDAAVLVATARRTHAAEVKHAAEALQGAGLKVVAAILLTTPHSNGASGASRGKTKRR
jgi:capsular polysaccharide biosynthesis protein